MKTCTKCRCSYPATSEYFCRDKYMTLGLKSWCKKCQSAYSKSRRTPELNKLRRERMKGKHEYDFKCYLRYKYSISLEAYTAMLNAQGGVCAICEQPPRNRRLCLDHCHKTGANRALLCNMCNSALERIETMPGWSEKAISYLVKYEIAAREKELINDKG